jgi:hypothetical protein
MCKTACETSISLTDLNDILKESLKNNDENIGNIIINYLFMCDNCEMIIPNIDDERKDYVIDNELCNNCNLEILMGFTLNFELYENDVEEFLMTTDYYGLCDKEKYEMIQNIDLINACYDENAVIVDYTLIYEIAKRLK